MGWPVWVVYITLSRSSLECSLFRAVTLSDERDGVIDFTRHRESNEYDSSFETDSHSVVAVDERSSRRYLVASSPARRHLKVQREVVAKKYSLEQKRRQRNCFLALDASLHEAQKAHQRPALLPMLDLQADGRHESRPHRHRCDPREPPGHYDKLFKEYCICDHTYYQTNKIANRWRIELQVKVMAGKGQFSCGDCYCKEASGLRTWEINFAYFENDERKNALVNLRLRKECSFKLN
ncbi:hypothetical protein MTO96_041135 [Rhipicephalus appendiculatus]